MVSNGSSGSTLVNPAESRKDELDQIKVPDHLTERLTEPKTSSLSEHPLLARLKKFNNVRQRAGCAEHHAAAGRAVAARGPTAA